MKNYYVQQWEDSEKGFNLSTKNMLVTWFPPIAAQGKIEAKKVLRNNLLTSYIQSLEGMVEKLRGIKVIKFPDTDAIGRPIPQENEIEVSMYYNGFNSCLDRQIGELDEGIIRLKTLI